MINWLTNTIIGKFITTFMISMVPIIELRGGLPYGLAVCNLDFPLALTAAILGNMLPVPFIVYFIESIFKWMKHSIPKMSNFISKMEKKADDKRDIIDKYGSLGLILLVAIPLPGTGAWTGSLVAALLGIKPKKAFPCIFAGVVIAAAIMTVLTKLGVIIFF